MLPLAFASSREATVESTAMLAMVPHKTSYMHHTRSVRSDQGKEDPRVYFALKSRVPNRYRFPLESREMYKTRKQERVDILGIIWPRDKSPDKDMFLLVASSGRQVQ